MAPCDHHHKAKSPTAHLREEHDVILRVLALLEQLGQELEAGREVDHSTTAWVEDFLSTFVDRCHHGKEERYLFPMLERYGIPREGGPLGVMLHEHDQGRALLRAMGLKSEGKKEETVNAIRDYVALLRAHIDKENNVLFRLAEQVLPDRVQKELTQSFELSEETDVGLGVHQRFLSELARLEASCCPSLEHHSKPADLPRFLSHP